MYIVHCWTSAKRSKSEPPASRSAVGRTLAPAPVHRHRQSLRCLPPRGEHSTFVNDYERRRLVSARARRADRASVERVHCATAEGESADRATADCYRGQYYYDFEQPCCCSAADGPGESATATNQGLLIHY